MEFQALDRERVNVRLGLVEQPPGERVEHGRLVLPGDLHCLDPADHIARYDDGVPRAGLVVLGVLAEGEPLCQLAVRPCHAYREHANLAAVANALVRLRDAYRHAVVRLCENKEGDQP